LWDGKQTVGKGKMRKSKEGKLLISGGNKELKDGKKRGDWSGQGGVMKGGGQVLVGQKRNLKKKKHESDQSRRRGKGGGQGTTIRKTLSRNGELCKEYSIKKSLGKKWGKITCNTILTCLRGK